MSADEHVARVTYLPWATPQTTPGGEPPLDNPAEETSARDPIKETSVRGPIEEITARGEPIEEITARGASAGSTPPGSASTNEMTADFDRVDRVVTNALRRRGLSRWEVGELLSRSDVVEPEREAWLLRYEHLGYVDDAALAAQLVRTHHERKGLGRQAVAQELKRRHIDQVIIDEALENIDVDDELARATELAVKRAEQLAGYDPQTAKRRLHAFLARKGYSGSVVRQAMEAARDIDSGDLPQRST